MLPTSGASEATGMRRPSDGGTVPEPCRCCMLQRRAALCALLLRCAARLGCRCAPPLALPRGSLIALVAIHGLLDRARGPERRTRLLRASQIGGSNLVRQPHRSRMGTVLSAYTLVVAGPLLAPPVNGCAARRCSAAGPLLVLTCSLCCALQKHQHGRTHTAPFCALP